MVCPAPYQWLRHEDTFSDDGRSLATSTVKLLTIEKLADGPGVDSPGRRLRTESRRVLLRCRTPAPGPGYG